MAIALLDHLRSVFTSASTSELARSIGEDTTRTQKAVDGLLPTLTAGVINRTATDEGATILHNLLRSTPFDTDPTMSQLVSTDSHRQKSAQSGNRILQQLFGDRAQQVPAEVAKYSGVSGPSATTLTGLVMSVLMGFLHKEVGSRNLTGAQLATMLGTGSSTARAAVPAGLAGGLAWLLGGDTQRTTTTVRTEPVARPVEERKEGTPWWRYLLYLLPLLLLFLLLRNCKNDDDKATTTTTDTTTSETSSDNTAVMTDTVASDLDGNGISAAQADAPDVRVGVDLPGGRKLSVVEKSFNYSLAQFLATKGGKLPKIFTFDNLTFETNSARITAEARPNVNDLIQIMQSYPTLAIRIEGNTDSTGDDAINDPLSGERAEAVKQALIEGGIDASRITTRERGDTKPVASNATEEGRQKNRRIDVIVTKV